MHGIIAKSTRLSRWTATVAALALGLLTALTFEAQAQSTKQVAAEAWVAQSADRLVELVTADTSQAEKRSEFQAFMEEMSALPAIARTALGRPWRDMNSAEKKDYQDVFGPFIARKYVAAFDQYNGEKLEVLNSTDEGKKGVYVQTRAMRPGQKPFNVEWRVIDLGDGPRLFDVKVEGVSLLVTQRDEFSGILQQNGNDIQAFISSLRSKI